MEKAEFEHRAESQGYDEPELRTYEANLSGNLHAHEFSAMLLVVRGAFTLAFENESVVLAPGDTCEVSAGRLHDERTGADGATILLARK